MDDLGGDVWVVIENVWYRKMFGEEVMKERKRFGVGIINW